MRDKSVTKDYYINKLGFQEMSDYSNNIIFKKDAIELHFFEFKELNISENYGQVYIRTKSIEKIYQTFLNKEVIHPNRHLETKPWGQKEYSVLDPDNNLSFDFWRTNKIGALNATLNLIIFHFILSK